MRPFGQLVIELSDIYSCATDICCKRGQMRFFAHTACRGWVRPLMIWVAMVSFGATQLGSVAAQERDRDDRITAKILSLEQLWNMAEVQKDIHSLNQLLSDKFIYVDIDGSLIKSKTEFLSSVTHRAEHIDSIRGESMTTQVHGDTVVVTGIYHEKGTLNGKPYYHHGRFTDTWVKDGSAWLCAASQSTLMQK